VDQAFILAVEDSLTMAVITEGTMAVIMEDTTVAITAIISALSRRLPAEAAPGRGRCST